MITNNYLTNNQVTNVSQISTVENQYKIEDMLTLSIIPSNSHIGQVKKMINSNNLKIYTNRVNKS